MMVMCSPRLRNLADKLRDRRAMTLVTDQHLEEPVRHGFLLAFIHALHAVGYRFVKCDGHVVQELRNLAVRAHRNVHRNCFDFVVDDLERLAGFDTDTCLG
jgi:hypothetical protein